MDDKLTTVAAKLPQTLRDAFDVACKSRQVTPSAQIRRLIEAYLAGADDGDMPGEVERAVRDEVEERQGDLQSAKAAAAVNLARRMDRDPTSGAQNAAQLRLLLGDLVPAEVEVRFDSVNYLRLQRAMRIRGLEIYDTNSGQIMSLLDIKGDARAEFIKDVS